LVVAAVALLSACSSQVSGKPVGHVIPGTVQASFLDIDAASATLGFALTTSDSSSEPPPALAAAPATCADAIGPATKAVYAQGWTNFWSLTFSDEDGNHTVTQVLGLYPSDDQASKVFGALTDGVKGCTSAVRTDDDQTTSQWTYAVGTADASALVWTATQNDAEGWACYRQARLKGKAVLQVAVCEAGDGSQAAAKIVDQFARQVRG
jgi:hypothetical protein